MSVVALRKESVDRNLSLICFGSLAGPSLSARRAWIEIKYVVKDSDFTGSLSARRAWIEMPDKTHQRELFQRRSPQGERG